MRIPVGGWIVLVLLVPMAGAMTILEDGANDVAVRANGGDAATLPEGAESAADLRSLRILEAPNSFDLRVGLESLEDPEDTAYADRYLGITLRHNDQGYRVMGFLLVGQQFQAALYEEDPAAFSGYTYLGPVSAVYHPDETEIGFEVDRAALVDSKGATPVLGRSLEDIEVQSLSFYTASALASAFPSIVTGDPHLIVLEDLMGSDEPGVYDVQVGVDQLGDAQLRSDEPFRFSNGEASTFVYWVNATHNGDAAATYSLGAANVPDGWDVQLPGGSFQLAPDQRLRFPVVVQTPFAHAHGTSQAFQVEMTQQGGDSLGRLELGILYPEIPQPAGHHDTLRLWSRDGSGYTMEEALTDVHEAAFGNDGTEVAYMNGAAEDENSLERPVDFEFCAGGALADVVTGAGESEAHCLHVDLAPGLKMGLDMRPDEQGTLSIRVEAGQPMEQVVVSGQLLHRIPTTESFGNGITRTTFEETVLGEIPATDPASWSLGDIVDLELPVVLTPDADYVPYQRHAGLRLDLRITNAGVDDGQIIGMDIEPRLHIGGTLQLPLNEYKDAVANLPDLGGGVSWRAGDADRLVNPGKTVVFQATLHNSGEKDTFDVRLVGVNAEWAELVGPTKLTLDRNGTQDYTIAVRPPKGALAGDVADLVLEAASGTELGQRALLQLQATVETDQDIPDEESQVGEYKDPSKDSPGVPLLALVGLLAVAVRVSKRS